MKHLVKQLSWEALATELSVTRQAVVLWRRLDGAPTDRDPDKWRAFMRERQLGSRLVEPGSLKEEKLKWEIELLRNRDAKDKRTVIQAEEVNALLLNLSTQSRTVLYQFMETEAPPKLDGMSAAQMRSILREMADTICERMADLIKEFEER